MWSKTGRLNSLGILIIGILLSIILVFIKLVFSLVELSWWIVLLPYLVSILLVSTGVICCAFNLKELRSRIIYLLILGFMLFFTIGFMLVDFIVKFIYEKFIK